MPRPIIIINNKEREYYSTQQKKTARVTVWNDLYGSTVDDAPVIDVEYVLEMQENCSTLDIVFLISSTVVSSSLSAVFFAVVDCTVPDKHVVLLDYGRTIE